MTPSCLRWCTTFQRDKTWVMFTNRQTPWLLLKGVPLFKPWFKVWSSGLVHPLYPLPTSLPLSPSSLLPLYLSTSTSPSLSLPLSPSPFLPPSSLPPPPPSPLISHRPPCNHDPTSLKFHHLKIYLLLKIPHSILLVPLNPVEAKILVTHKLKVVSHVLKGGSH